MLSTMISALTIMLIAALTMTAAALLSKKAITDREKCSPFECGFDPSASSRLPFSLRFFLIAIIFLIFDVEIALILPIIVIINLSNLTFWMITSVYFISILLLGLYHEWKQGALEWTT